MKDDVTTGQIDRMEAELARYSHKPRLQRAFGQSEFWTDLFALIDEHGEDQSKMWRSARKFYKSFFGFDCPRVKLAVPRVQARFNWILPIFAIDANCPIEATYRALAKNFKCWRSTEEILDEVVTKHVRDPRQKPYVARFRDGEEADEVLKGLSANALDARQIKGNTLLEPMILEGWYYAETGRHLNQKTVNLCSGSRSRRGDVPNVYWSSVNESFYVYTDWYSPGNANAGLRARQVVS